MTTLIPKTTNMKAISTRHLISAVLSVTLVLGSCSSYRQVACPEIDQNNYLARQTSRIKARAPHRTRQTYARNLEKLSANRYGTKNSRSTRDIGSAVVADKVMELTPVTMTEGQLDNRNDLNLNLLASADNSSAGTGMAEGSREVLAVSSGTRTEAGSGSLELMTPREMRKFNRNLERELSRSLQVAPRAASPTSNAKPAKGLAIASLVLGISSFFIFPVATGVLAVVFGGMALKRIKANPNQEGAKMAKAGMILGIVGLALWVVFIALGYGAAFSIF